MNEELPDQEEREESSALTKSERKQRRREEKQREREDRVRARARKKMLGRVVVSVVVVAIVAFVGWRVAQSPSRSGDDPVVSRGGLHVHTRLSIFINGEAVSVPGGIGLGGLHADMHTHAVNDQIHIEMNRAVRASDMRLGRFFDIWGKQFSSQCILDSCNSDEGTVKLIVNGQENSEFDNYVMADGDQVEIRFE